MQSFTTQWLEEQLGLARGKILRVEVVTRFEALATELLRLKLEFRSSVNLPATMIYKRCEGELFDATGRAEIKFFTEFAPQMLEPAIPRIYAFEMNKLEKICWLLFEDLEVNYAHPSYPFTQNILELATDELVHLHAHWWNHEILEQLDFKTVRDDPMRMAQALAPDGIQFHAQQARVATAEFLEKFEAELLPEEKVFLKRLAQNWERLALERWKDFSHTTLIHADFHLLGNFFVPNNFNAARAKIIDWGQYRRGLGCHDLAYMLTNDELVEGRLERDLQLLTRYHHGLGNLGIQDYSWTQCQSDFRFSIVTTVFQSIFQESLSWAKKSIRNAIIRDGVDRMLEKPQ
jgi:Phosphotransferase enzyme family